MTPSGTDWLARLARELGVDPPTEDEQAALLALAGTAAHASERIAAPLSCWLVARGGLTAAQGRDVVVQLAERVAREDGPESAP